VSLKNEPLLWHLAVIWQKDRHLSFAARQAAFQHSKTSRSGDM